MTPTRQGSIRLFRFAGIDVYLHWSWFLLAVYGISSRGARYTSTAWPVLEYLALFGIVLLHEFGHALACRQVPSYLMVPDNDGIQRMCISRFLAP